MANDDPHEELELLAQRLPRELEPPAEIWPRIAARLATPSEPALDALTRRLSADLPPPASVWAGVAAGIGTRRESRRAAWLGAAVVLAALAAWLTVANRTPVDVVTDAPMVDTAVPTREPDASFGAAWLLRTPEVSADVAAALLGSLALVQSERLAIERALEGAPDNRDLRELWAHAYEAELGLNDTYGRTIMAYQRGSGI